jgi:predicted ATPase
VERLLLAPATRLLTLVGPPGVGKTRLAQHAATTLLPAFDEAVFYVPLAPLSQPAQVPSAIARTLELTERAGSPLVEQLKNHLYQRRALLLLDNCEHLAIAELVADLLAACPQLKVLVTSQAPLRLRAERLMQVAPLALPPTSEMLPAIAASPAVQLFCDRVQALHPEFELEASNAATVAQICARLDGLPLALELAAARCAEGSPAALLAQLGQRLPLLTDGPRDLPARQQTLRQALAWSYSLLPTHEQQLFACLGVFVGGFTELAIAAISQWRLVVGGDVHVNLQSLIANLHSRSLLQSAEPAAGEARFTLLETLREFALERLHEAGELAAVRQRHMAYFVDMAERAEPELRGPQFAQWLARLDADLNNLRAAMRWSLEVDGGVSAARIGAALLTYWRARGLYTEGRQWLEPLLTELDGPEALPPLVQARAAYTAAFLASQQSDRGCYELAERSLALYRRLGDQIAVARLLNFLGILNRFPGRLALSDALHSESLAILQREGAGEWLGYTHNCIGLQRMTEGRYAECEQHFLQALALERQHHNHERAVAYLPRLAKTVWFLGDEGRARAIAAEGLAEARRFNHQEASAESLHVLGLCAFARGDAGETERYYSESLASYRDMWLVYAILKVLRDWGFLHLHHHRYSEAAVLFREQLHLSALPGNIETITHATLGLAAVVLAEGQAEAAVRLLGAAAAQRTAYQLRPYPMCDSVCEQTLATTRQHLAPSSWQRAWDAGQRLTAEELLAEVRS